MTSIKRVFQNAALSLGAVAAALIALGADAPPQKIDAGGLTFEVPASWKSSKPRSAMRLAQLTVDPVKGDAEPAELVVFAFPGGGGTVEANLKRWQDGFQDENGKSPKIETKVVKGKNVEVTRAETAGRYVAAVFPGSPEVNNKPNFRLLGGIVQADGTGYYLKMVGPDKTVTAARAGFDAMLASMQAKSK